MRKAKRNILLLIMTCILGIGLISISTISKLLAAIFLPPVLAVILFAIMVSLIDMNQKQLKHVYIIFAFFLIGVSLFSTAVGFHYASDQINESFFPYSSDFSLDDLLFTKEQLYYLDELFSHWLMIAGFVIIMVGVFTWWYYFKKRELPIIEPSSEDTLLNVFFPIFFGSLIGGSAGLGAIESQLTSYSLVIGAAILPYIFYKIRNFPITREKITFQFLFISTSIGSYLGICLAHVITMKAFPSI